MFNIIEQTGGIDNKYPGTFSARCTIQWDGSPDTEVAFVSLPSRELFSSGHIRENVNGVTHIERKEKTSAKGNSYIVVQCFGEKKGGKTALQTNPAPVTHPPAQTPHSEPTNAPQRMFNGYGKPSYTLEEYELLWNRGLMFVGRHIDKDKTPELYEKLVATYIIGAQGAGVKVKGDDAALETAFYDDQEPAGDAAEPKKPLPF